MLPKKDLRVKGGYLSICTSNPCVSKSLTPFALWSRKSEVWEQDRGILELKTALKTN